MKETICVRLSEIGGRKNEFDFMREQHMIWTESGPQKNNFLWASQPCPLELAGVNSGRGRLFFHNFPSLYFLSMDSIIIIVVI